jgi:co-chaperonin GroES (HSP10)
MAEIIENFFTNSVDEVEAETTPEVVAAVYEYEDFTPLNDIVMIKVIEEKNEKVKGSEIIIAAQKWQEQSNKAEVIAVGPKVTAVKPGDRVLFSQYIVDEFSNDGETFFLTREADLKGVARRKVS